MGDLCLHLLLDIVNCSNYFHWEKKKEKQMSAITRYAGSFAHGKRAEHLFSRVAQTNGWHVTAAHRHNDINEHWDCRIEREQCDERHGAERYRVDVKAMKRQSRSDAEPQDSWTWLELHGVRKNDQGWLYGGHAELIAFETRNSFVLVERIALMDLVESLVDPRSERVHRAYEAKYRLYSRPNRHDIITMVEMDKIRPVAWDEWLF